MSLSPVDFIDFIDLQLFVHSFGPDVIFLIGIPQDQMIRNGSFTIRFILFIED